MTFRSIIDSLKCAIYFASLLMNSHPAPIDFDAGFFICGCDRNFGICFHSRNTNKTDAIMNKVFMTIFTVLLLAVLPSFIGQAEASPNHNPEVSFVDVTETDATVVADHKPIGIKATATIGEAFAYMGGDNNDNFANAIIPSRFQGTYLEGNMIHLNNGINDERQFIQTPAFIKRE